MAPWKSPNLKPETWKIGHLQLSFCLILVVIILSLVSRQCRPIKKEKRIITALKTCEHLLSQRSPLSTERATGILWCVKIMKPDEKSLEINKLSDECDSRRRCGHNLNTTADLTKRPTTLKTKAKKTGKIVKRFFWFTANVSPSFTCIYIYYMSQQL